jgi:hypothetical protein
MRKLGNPVKIRRANDTGTMILTVNRTWMQMYEVSEGDTVDQLVDKQGNLIIRPRKPVKV